MWGTALGHGRAPANTGSGGSFAASGARVPCGLRDQTSVVSDAANGWLLITSRTPDDLDDFVGEIDKALAGTA